MVDRGIVVDLDDDDALFGLFQVDAVEAFADQAGGADGGVDDFRGRVFDGHRGEAAFGGLAVLAVLDRLPVAAGHAVLAGIERLAVEDADAPVEFRRAEFLGDDEGGVLEHLLGALLQLVERVGLDHVDAEAAIRGFQDDGRAEPVEQGGEVGLLVDNLRTRNGQAGLLEDFLEVDLVGAADHRLGVVDHGHAFLFGAAGEAVGEVVDGGGGADEEGVELGEGGQVGRVDQLDLDAHLLGDIGEAFQRGGLGRRGLLVRIDQNREGPLGRRARLFALHPALGVGLHGVEEEGAPGVLELVGRHGADAGDAVRGFGVELDLERGGAVPVHGLAGEFLIGGDFAAGEGDEQALDLGGALGERFLEGLAEIRQGVVVERLLGELDHGLDGGADAVAAGLGQQRGVVAFGLVGVGAGEVQDVGAASGEEGRFRDIVRDTQHLVRCFGLRNVAR